MSEPLQILDIEYSQWKQMNTKLAGVVYYIPSKLSYILVLVDLKRGFISLCHLKFKGKADKPNILDFETNLKSSAISQLSMEACIASAIIGS